MKAKIEYYNTWFPPVVLKKILYNSLLCNIKTNIKNIYGENIKEKDSKIEVCFYVYFRLFFCYKRTEVNILSTNLENNKIIFEIKSRYGYNFFYKKKLKKIITKIIDNSLKEEISRIIEKQKMKILLNTS